MIYRLRLARVVSESDVSHVKPFLSPILLPFVRMNVILAKDKLTVSTKTAAASAFREQLRLRILTRELPLSFPIWHLQPSLRDLCLRVLPLLLLLPTA